MYRRSRLAVAGAETVRGASRLHITAVQMRGGYSKARVSRPGLKPGRRMGDPAFRFAWCWEAARTKIVQWTTFTWFAC